MIRARCLAGLSVAALAVSVLGALPASLGRGEG